ncbi:hypothetical protein ACFFQF_16550 [Haladaptatus pallidirubidus]|uniref:hypothetical protein n=1 Tax=Haladaptatus pallidirubidus TaxID=1008152 RepID=UPI0035EAEAE5
MSPAHQVVRMSRKLREEFEDKCLEELRNDHDAKEVDERVTNALQEPGVTPAGPGEWPQKHAQINERAFKAEDKNSNRYRPGLHNTENDTETNPNAQLREL